MTETTANDDASSADHRADEGGGGSNAPGKPPIEQNLKSRSTWLRLVFMVIFYLLAGVASMVASVVVVLGFFWVLFTGETNERLKRTGQGIAVYISQIIRYLTYNSEERPFPFDAEWPAADGD